jgi:hypothetical protein
MAGKPVVAVEARPAMHCTLQVQIINRGRLTVTLNKLVLPYLGPGTGTVVQAAPVNGIEPRTVPDDSIDAEYRIGRSLPPGKTRTVTVAFVYHESGCMAAGAVGLDHWPRLEASVLGRTGVVNGTDTLTISSSHQISGDCTD